MVLRDIWDQSHTWRLGYHGTSPNCGFLVPMGLNCENFGMRHLWDRDQEKSSSGKKFESPKKSNFFPLELFSSNFFT